ncbi:MAG: glycogen synthase GlgA [bacterium]
MKICFAISECVPFIKTGGLADVGGALPKALADAGCEVKVFLPLYAAVNILEHELVFVEALQNVPVQVAGKTVAFNVWCGNLPESDVPVYFIECPAYFQRPEIYTRHADEDERFIFFQLAILAVMQRLQWSPDLVHCNDWQTALLPVYLKINFSLDKLFAQTATMLSIHNIGYQGRFPKESLHRAGLPDEHFYPGGPFEIDEKFCFLKAGLMFADVITTVSETYAQEIQTHTYGAGLDGVLANRKQDLFGILNGIDTREWNPKIDLRLPFRYSLRNIDNKLKNKRALLSYVQLPFDENIATIGMVTRLVAQKGLELLPPIIEALMRLPLQLVILGSGEMEYEFFLQRTAQTFPFQFHATIGYDHDLSHLITAGCDLFLMPSRYEPCGLNQMYSLNYGTVPIVRKTGGLADTVHDYHEFYEEGNGFSFQEYSAHSLLLTVRRALDVFPDKKVWKKIMKRGMQQDFSWDASAKRYVELYRKTKKRLQKVSY